MNIDKERQAFEAWYKKDGRGKVGRPDFSKSDQGVYFSFGPRADFQVWQARAALDAKKAAPSDLDIWNLARECDLASDEELLTFARALLSGYGERVHKIDISTEHVEESVKNEHEPIGYVHPNVAIYGRSGKYGVKEGVTFLHVENRGIPVYLHPAPTNEQDARDAERYRWLRNESWAGYNVAKSKPQIASTVVFVDKYIRSIDCILAEQALDEAIDAAIAKQGKK